MEQMLRSMEKIWARATGHLMGSTDSDKPDVPILTLRTDSDKPDVPILTLREARIALYLKTFWTVIHVITCVFIIANVIRHW